MECATITAALEPEGLLLRGGFQPEPQDAVPPFDDGRAARTLLLVGNAGGAMWRAFARAPESGSGPDPLNRWSERVIGGLAARLGARALFPFGGPPYLPFATWAKRAEPVADSPLGMLIHPDYGLWHAYRGALAFAESIDLPPPDHRPSPCTSCAERPCLSACPVGAFGEAAYDVAACVEHIASQAGAECMEHACRARRACPVGRDYLYEAEQARFHMRHFLEARRRAGAPA